MRPGDTPPGNVRPGDAPDAASPRPNPLFRDSDAPKSEPPHLTLSHPTPLRDWPPQLLLDYLQALAVESYEELADGTPSDATIRAIQTARAEIERRIAS